MKSLKNILLSSSLILLALLLASCVATSTTGKQDSGMAAQDSLPPAAEPALTPAPPPPPATLPVRYQRASYFVDQEDHEQEEATLAEESALKVGARITSTSGPQPLWDIMKRLAALKEMNVSWASDVDQNVLVDVNISAQDDFFLAIDNLLRQVDYYHEVQGSTIIVKYKETRQFHIAMPFLKQAYKTDTGGDVLGSSGGEGSSDVRGEISLMTDGTAINNPHDGKPGGIEFNTWNSIENNLNAVLNIWSTDEVEATDATATTESNTPGTGSPDSQVVDAQQEVRATFRRSSGGNSYFIDKPVGLITVTAPRPLMDKLEVYFSSLKRELYKQVSIEAKIIEVQLDDHSAIGLNWNQIFESLTIGPGLFTINDTYSRTTTDSENSSLTTNRSNTTTNTTTRTRDRGFDYTLPDSLTGDTGTNLFNGVTESIAGSVATSGVTAAKIITEGLSSSLGGAISLAAFSFDSFVKAVDEQGETTILSNPKLSVMNGQPSLITVGRNVTYIDSITSDTDGNTGTITYTAETARALSGVGLALTANILDDNEIILNLVPVTSELEEPIEYRQLGLGEIGLPIISVREISTTVKVKDGEMLVIGGLITSVSSKDDSFIPGTKNIPFFKYLFGYEEKLERKRELIILLQPRII
jgi:general secretion pathway protein D/MSHA biogenesis protein MshL